MFSHLPLNIRRIAIFAVLILTPVFYVQGDTLAAEMTFNLVEGFNGISLPFGNSGITNAEKLCQSIPYCESVSYWDAPTQKFVTYLKGSSENNFPVTPGYPYFAEVTQDTNWTVLGDVLTSLVFDLLTTDGTDINSIAIPFHGIPFITNAEELADSIPHCDIVWYWDAMAQGFVGHPKGTNINNFAVFPGFPYFVNITADTKWPFDLTNPTISITSPRDGAFLNTTKPKVSITYSDDYSGLNLSSFRVYINGLDSTSLFTITATGAEYQLTSDLPIGNNNITASISDNAGNTSSTTSNFSVGILRAIPGASPTSGVAPLTVHFTTNGEDPGGTIQVFRWDFDGNGSWDTYDSVARDYDFTYNTGGTYNATLFVQSSTGMTATGSITITVQSPPPIDLTNPTISITSPRDGAFLNTTKPKVSITYSDDYSGLNLSSFRVYINGLDSTSLFTITATGAEYQLTSDLPIGNNNITASISDNAGNTSSTTSNFSVGILRAIPGASPTSGVAPLTVHFTTNGEDPGGTIQVFRWDFDGDGSWDNYDSVARDYDFTYNTGGTYNATLFVQSSTGKTATASITITVQNPPPVPTANLVPSNGPVPLNVQFLGTGTSLVGSIILYEWDFDGDGIFDWSSTISGNTTYTYNTVGTYQGIFRVTDNMGQKATASAYTTVINAAPPGSPTATASATPTEGDAPLAVTFSGTGTDPNHAIVLYEWDLDGDGVYEWSSTTSGNTTYTYTKSGLHVARFRVTNSIGLTGVHQVGIIMHIKVSLSVPINTVGNLSDLINLTSLGGVTVTASSIYEWCSTYYPASNLLDGDFYTYWMSVPGDTPNQGANTFVETVFANPRKVTEVSVKGGSNFDYYGVTRARLQFFDEANNPLYSSEVDLSTDARITTGLLENVKRFRLTALAANDGGGLYNQVSIAEIEIFYVNNYTANASSIFDTNYSDWCKVENLFIPNQSWYSAIGDHPDLGSNPWVEVNFDSDQKISRIIIDQTWNYYYSGVTRAKIDLIDDSGNILYETQNDLMSDYETIDFLDIKNVKVFRLTVLAANAAWGASYVTIDNLDILTNIGGQFVSLVLLQKQDQGVYSASSEWKSDCSGYYPTNLIDGNIETYWLTRENQTPNQGVFPYVDITFPSPQTISLIRINGGSSYPYDGITQAKIELFDTNNVVLYSQEQALQSVSEIPVANISNVSRCRFTALGNQAYSTMCGWSEIGIYQKFVTPEPTPGNIDTYLGADTSVTIYIKDAYGNTVRTLVNNQPRTMGTYTDKWDCKDDNRFIVNDGPYYSVLQYGENGKIITYDLSKTTGGSQFLPQRQQTGGNEGAPALSKPFENQFLPIKFTLNQAAEVTLFVGVLYTSDTRIRTILNRIPFPAGEHTVYWDGLDDQGNITAPPPGDSLILGLWGYTLPTNAVYMTGGRPVISKVEANPNYFSPFSEKCMNDGSGEGIMLKYEVSEDVSSIQLRVYDAKTGYLIRTAYQFNISAGEHTFFWDGKNNNGEYADVGDYRVGLIARDIQGNESMLKYTLVRLDY
jgi:PKD repeat protein/flagellar hook assembly protein FlgD